jgi:hypothetical protein
LAQELIEPSRTWDSVFEAVKAANSVEGFTGEEGNLNIVFKPKDSRRQTTCRNQISISGEFSA